MERDSALGAIQPGLKNLKQSHVIETEFPAGVGSRKQDGCSYEVETVLVK